MGRDTGLCRGRGGSMHVADVSIGMLGANGIVGAGLPITLGSALAHQVRGTKAVAVAYFGDGALAEGVLHECLNIAALWSLPMLFACENNGWSEFSPTHRQMKASLKALAAAFAVPHVEVDGNDVEAVADTAADWIAAIREGSGPRVLECRTTRVRGHFEGDRQDYRAADEIAGLKDVDPIGRCRARLSALDVDPELVEAIDAAVDRRIAQAVERARGAPETAFDAAVAAVYTVAGA